MKTDLLEKAVQAIERDLDQEIKKSEAETPKKKGDWPERPGDDAFHGLAGEIVNAIEPHTESDPIALLFLFLVYFGNVIGRGAHFMVEATRHALNLFIVLIGNTAKGRKGTAGDHIKCLFQSIDSPWLANRFMSGLSSGEGLIWNVRDAIAHGDQITDPGEPDKRLLAVETEFARVLKTMRRDGNTLSPILKDAWDGGILRTLTKNSPLKSTESHIGIVGHCTKDEILRYLNEIEMANGYANRHIWVCVKRSKLLPRGGKIEEANLKPLIKRLHEAVKFANSVKEMRFDEETGKLWDEKYPELSKEIPGLFGAIIARSEPQTLRLSCLYALLDKSDIIKQEHLKAGIALWKYCERSAEYIFGDSLGDPVADQIIQALRKSPDGLTRTSINNLFDRNRKAEEIDCGLSVLEQRDMARAVSEIGSDSKKPTERWFAKE